MISNKVKLYSVAAIALGVAYLLIDAGGMREQNRITMLGSMAYLQQDIVVMQETGELVGEISEEVRALCEDHFDACQDPWGHEIEIAVWTEKICVSSLGQDGEIGGTEFDNDISFCVERLY